MKSSIFINTFSIILASFFIMPILGCNKKTTEFATRNTASNKPSMQVVTDTATFAAGCFWCVEEQFKQLNGVLSVTSGYTGGTLSNPTYEEVTSGNTGHAEACAIVFNPQVISYRELLQAFFVAHDPTQLNRQGNDIGTQYRSAIFYHNSEQKELAEFYINALNKEKAYNQPIVTEVSLFKTFYPAEEYHQNYYENNPDKAYCRLVIQPKLEKFKKVFKEQLKK
ncbi:peptide-methionine (S)-S-oxide reductase MsrA [Paenimyroides aestuarii]|uniref:Peptide methionine sulfoxide reductase MsrA n=1 Tax=Paenimyroides aestuarii TaxID=2968490 RepID=A0ABY5NPF9_9FLAO|nr:peptide-methionine (S)-S-oxide reductase MsrA [Paenimyroides aestuarii]UUV20387.1 peptide-methionine (S)-S-oxide reductase MsrA [Paenimyroides aestuarii]